MNFVGCFQMFILCVLAFLQKPTSSRAQDWIRTLCIFKGKCQLLKKPGRNSYGCIMKNFHCKLLLLNAALIACRRKFFVLLAHIIRKPT